MPYDLEVPDVLLLTEVEGAVAVGDGLRWFDTVPAGRVVVVDGVLLTLAVFLFTVAVFLLTVAVFLLAAALAGVAATLVAVVLPVEAVTPVEVLLPEVPEVLRLMLLIDVPPRVDTLLVNTLSEPV